MYNIKNTRLSSFIILFYLSIVLCFPAKAEAIKVFFAGDLFSYKDLVGNLQLSEAIKRRSNGKYDCFLAQNKVQQLVHHKSIKDQDLKGLMESDIAIFAFDGPELDSGTVVEFVSAKLLDKPSVVYRSDFRGGSGEEVSTAEQENSNKWNLMVSYYPRTEYVYFNGMIQYQNVLKNSEDQSAININGQYVEYIAQLLITSMDRVYETPKILTEKEQNMVNKQFQTLMNIQ